MEDIVDLVSISLKDVAKVGGKNASTGEMLRHLVKQGIRVPNGFATTTAAYQRFIQHNDLQQKITHILAKLDSRKIKSLQAASHKIQQLILKQPFSPDFTKAIAIAYKNLKQPTVAVRSSSTTEDLVNTSFAGQQETFLNIQGVKNVTDAIKRVFASLYTSRAIAYRDHQGLHDTAIAISAGVQTMVRSDKGASGVIFTLDTESGFDEVILLTGSYGLGETIVQGRVTPDTFYLHKLALTEGRSAILQRNLGKKTVQMIYTKTNTAHRSTKYVPVPQKMQTRFCLTDEELHELARQALLIEKHYGKPMDIEWAKDGVDGKLYIVQARPETVKANVKKEKVIERYTLQEKGKQLLSGQSIGQKISVGKARLVNDPKKMHLLQKGEILVTDMTDPDWEPIMKKSAGIITNRGGRTCHAAIIARELGIPAIVGCENATTVIRNQQKITVSCAEGQRGYVYDGELKFTQEKIAIEKMPSLPVQICMNLGNPERAFDLHAMPHQGIGLARIEFIISSIIGIHPNAILNVKKLPNALKQKILKITAAYDSPTEFYIEKLREGIATIAAAVFPKPVIFRFSDFKSNEYANLLGGSLYELAEENPMIGFRGASRYINERFQSCFELECKALLRVRDEMGFHNAQIMVPFVRTVDEIKQVMQLMKNFGLQRGFNDLKVYMMCEIPSNVVIAEEFLKHVDGYSIGTNDLTQLVLGIDRDSSLIATIFDERNEAVKQLLHHVISICKRLKKYIGICGQAPSDYPEFAKWLMQEGIQSISLNPDTVIETWLALAERQEVCVNDYGTS